MKISEAKNMQHEFNTLQAKRTMKKYCKIKEASFDLGKGLAVRTCKNGPVYLYQIHGVGTVEFQFYTVVDDSGDCDIDFLIDQSNTAVTKEDRIVVEEYNWIMTLILEENAFAFYKSLFPHENFNVSINVGSFGLWVMMRKFCGG